MKKIKLILSILVMLLLVGAVTFFAMGYRNYSDKKFEFKSEIAQAVEENDDEQPVHSYLDGELKINWGSGVSSEIATDADKNELQKMASEGKYSEIMDKIDSIYAGKNKDDFYYFVAGIADMLNRESYNGVDYFSKMTNKNYHYFDMMLLSSKDMPFDYGETYYNVAKEAVETYPSDEYYLSVAMKAAYEHEKYVACNYYATLYLDSIGESYDAWKYYGVSLYYMDEKYEEALEAINNAKKCTEDSAEIADMDNLIKFMEAGAK